MTLQTLNIKGIQPARSAIKKHVLDNQITVLNQVMSENMNADQTADDRIINLEPFTAKETTIIPYWKGYNTPALGLLALPGTIVNDADNYYEFIYQMGVVVLTDGADATILQLKVERYLEALQRLLHEKAIPYDMGSKVAYVLCTEVDPSQEILTAEKNNTANHAFRKQGSITIQIHIKEG